MRSSSARDGSLQRTKLNANRCDQSSDCDVQNGYTCNSMKYCAPGAGGIGGSGTGGSGPAAAEAWEGRPALRAPAARRSRAPLPTARERCPSATSTRGPAAVATPRTAPLAPALTREHRSARRAALARWLGCASAASRTATATDPAGSSLQPVHRNLPGMHDFRRVRDGRCDQTGLRDHRDRQLDAGNVRWLPYERRLQRQRDEQDTDLQLVEHLCPLHRRLGLQGPRPGCLYARRPLRCRR